MYLFFIALKKYLTGLFWELCRSFFTCDQISSWNPPFLIFFIIPSHLRIKHAFAVLVQQSLLKMGNIKSLNDNYKFNWLNSILISNSPLGSSEPKLALNSRYPLCSLCRPLLGCWETTSIRKFSVQVKTGIIGAIWSFSFKVIISAPSIAQSSWNFFFR